MATAAPHGSPSSSPRLPSPPPMAEDQTGPQSPSLRSFEDHGRADGSISADDGASRRIRPGTNAVDMNEGPPLAELSDIDSPFQLTEHLKALYENYTHPPNTTTTIPISRATAAQLATAPSSTDRTLWLYELCRFLVQKANIIIIALFADSPACSAATCPEMRASEWQYLCAVHDPPKSCCAIDYCCHTLDWAAGVLTSPKHFPSRISLTPSVSSDSGTAPPAQLRQLTNIFRRVYRIFAHAWFQHREVFWRVDGRTGLYVLFKTVCDVYNLIPEDNYTIPPEAEGIEPAPGSTADDATKASNRHNVPSILRRPEDAESKAEANSPVTPLANMSIGPGATTRRHKQNPSKGANVATVIEENEEEEDAQSRAANSSADSVQPSTENDTEDDQKPVPRLVADRHSVIHIPQTSNTSVQPDIDSTADANADANATQAISTETAPDPSADIKQETPIPESSAENEIENENDNSAPIEVVKPAGQVETTEEESTPPPATADV